MAPEIILSEIEEKEFCEYLHQLLREFNNQISAYHRESRKPGAITPLNLILKDELGNIVGGLSASTSWGWLEINDFFLPAEFRGSGIGSRLLQTAETIAIERGCSRCFLTTFEFQARTFYEQHGYSVTGKLEDYPPGSTYYWMKKNLSPP